MVKKCFIRAIYDVSRLHAVNHIVVSEDYSSATHHITYTVFDKVKTITQTNENGSMEQELSYDACGNLRNPSTCSGDFTGRPIFDRGFTGHEHLYDFGLINMNGRMYDLVMSSFLSPDNYVQNPYNSQNFNRYSYCLNNPLKYNDTTGEWIQYIIGAIIGGFNGYMIADNLGYKDCDKF